MKNDKKSYIYIYIYKNCFSFIYQGYYIQVNKMIYGDRITPESLSAVINDLHPGLDYKINLIALTEHPVGKQRQTQQQEDEAYDSTYNSEDENYTNNNNNNSNKHQFTKSFDSGQRTQSTFSDGDELVNFMNTVKG